MKRLAAIFAAIFNKILGRAEGRYYGELLDYSYEELQNLLAKVSRDVAAVATNKHTIVQQVGTRRKEVAQLEQTAASFLAAGREDKAVEALNRKAIASQQLASLEADLQEVETAQQNLEVQHNALKDRIASFKSTKEVKKAKYGAAQAQVRIAETATGINEGALNIARTVGRLEEQTAQMEARSVAIGELVSSGTLDDMFSPGQTALEREGLALEREASVAADLERLKMALPAAGETSGS